ncbi:hypothetical protein [Salibacterium aidingense]|uniref:hypothetical protein n=1 Tax=Salibacterium aidingense TaxID=384933 RepID=UPI003BF6182B
METKGFWAEPTYLEAWAYTEIESPIEQWGTFAVTVCGGMSIWVNGILRHLMAPFSRNTGVTEQIELPLSAGENKIHIYYDDLAERDTKFMFRMDYLKGSNLTGAVPIADEDPDEINHLKEILQKGYFDKDTYKSGEITFCMGERAERSFFMKSEFQVERCNPQKFEHHVQKNEELINIGPIENFQMGYNEVAIIVSNERLFLERKFGVQIYPEQYENFHADALNERKKIALGVVSSHGEPNVHRVLANLYLNNHLTSDSIRVLEQDISWVENRLDCSDFSIVMYFRLLDMDDRHRLLTAELRSRIENAIIGYRYWMDEPGNDVMWFFSENHALIFHTSELLAGQRYYGTLFPNASLQGEEHYRKAKNLLITWFERFFKDGLAEWNSSPYIPINVIGLLQLYDFCQDEKLKDLAATALDMIFYWLAVNSFKGYLTCSQGRIYEKELKGHYNTQTTNLAWLAWGAANVNYSTFASVALSLSSYTPPVEYEEVLHACEKPFVYYHRQGVEGEVSLYTYKTKSFLLSSALNYRPFQKGYQEHVWQASFGPEENVWVTHPGELSKKGDGRPGYWAGNGYLPLLNQYYGLAVSYYNIDPSHDVNYTHAYVPLSSFDEYVLSKRWIFLRKKEGYLALFAENGMVLTAKGMDKNREFISVGRKNIWIVRTGTKNEFGDFHSFIRRIDNLNIQITYNQKDMSLEAVKLRDPMYGNVVLQGTGEMYVNQSRVNHDIPSVEGKIYRG